MKMGSGGLPLQQHNTECSPRHDADGMYAQTARGATGTLAGVTALCGQAVRAGLGGDVSHAVATLLWPAAGGGGGGWSSDRVVGEREAAVRDIEEWGIL
jgi:hypothetical protein